MSGGIDSLTNEILSRRGSGTTCVIKGRQAKDEGHEKPVTVVVDSFLSELGFIGLGEKWGRISTRVGKAIAQRILQSDLAYRAPIMSEMDSVRLAECFFSWFDDDVCCFTNGNAVLPLALPQEVPGASNPISQATFDSGVVCIDAHRIGILWVEDED
jgi:hypothetical protein